MHQSPSFNSQEWHLITPLTLCLLTKIYNLCDPSVSMHDNKMGVVFIIIKSHPFHHLYDLTFDTTKRMTKYRKQGRRLLLVPILSSFIN